MEKIFPILVVGILFFSGFGAVGTLAEKLVANLSEGQPELVVEVKGGFGVNLVIKNVGDADATDVLYFICIYGSWQGPSPNSDLGHLGTIPPGQSVKVRFRTVGFGVGIFADIPLIDVFADCAERSRYDISVNAWILFHWVLIK